MHSRTAGEDGDKYVARVGDKELGAVLADLLKVVKVAMPADLFVVDPRVRKARQLLAELTQVSENRPPAVISSSDADLVDLALSDTSLDLLTAEPEATWDITLGIDRFMVSGYAPANRQAAVEQIIREWLTANGYMELQPEEPN